MNQNPCSNHEVHMLFEHELYLTSLKMSPGPEVIKLEFILNSKYSAMIGCLRTCVRKQPIIALYFESVIFCEFFGICQM